MTIHKSIEGGTIKINHFFITLKGQEFEHLYLVYSDCLWPSFSNRHAPICILINESPLDQQRHN